MIFKSELFFGDEVAEVVHFLFPENQIESRFLSEGKVSCLSLETTNTNARDFCSVLFLLLSFSM